MSLQVTAWRGAAVVGLGAVATLLVPVLFGSFAQFLVLNVLLLALFALSFNLLFGTAGLLSFGQAAFYAGGAYAAGKLLRAGVPLLPAVLIGALAAAAMAVVVGAFCVRHTRIYFSMLTLAFGMFAYAVVWKWTEVTGGDDGLIGIPRGRLGLFGPLDASLAPLPRYYLFAAALVFISVAALHRLSISPFGLTLRAIGQNAERAEFSGVPVRRTIFIAFVVAGFFAGLAGALLAPLEQTVSPSAAHWTKSAEPVMATLIGGPLSFAGPIVGAAVYLGLKELIVRFTEYWLLVFGLVLLGAVLAFRGGLMGALEGLLKRVEGRRLKVERGTPSGPSERAGRA
ncbi:MAG TPA: branched-chain amino acid ABC transporter permease [Myxococcaceae bacterium]|nr:branched-chain amino acid ABC transporter permease [Myxococcaceae bacterium]